MGVVGHTQGEWNAHLIGLGVRARVCGDETEGTEERFERGLLRAQLGAFTLSPGLFLLAQSTPEPLLLHGSSELLLLEGATQSLLLEHLLTCCLLPLPLFLKDPPDALLLQPTAFLLPLQLEELSPSLLLE